MVDTVERLQGGERATIIVSGTASDPSAISAAADFILDLNRSNVAFSRVQDRLVVVCARTLLDHIPGDVEQYDEMMLWKALRSTAEPVLKRGSSGDAVRQLQQALKDLASTSVPPTAGSGPRLSRRSRRFSAPTGSRRMGSSARARG